MNLWGKASALPPTGLSINNLYLNTHGDKVICDLPVTDLLGDPGTMPVVSKRDEQVHARHPCANPYQIPCHPIVHALPLLDINKLLDGCGPSRVWPLDCLGLLCHAGNTIVQARQIRGVRETESIPRISRISRDLGMGSRGLFLPVSKT